MPLKSAASASNASGIPIAISTSFRPARVSVPNFGRNRRAAYAYSPQSSGSDGSVTFWSRSVLAGDGRS